MALVLAQDPPQMVLIPDEGAVKKLAATSADPAFGDRVHPGRADVAEHGPDPGISQGRVERSRVVRATVADQELDPVCLPCGVPEVCMPMSCGDGQGRPYGIMIIRVPAPALSHLRPALRLAGPTRPVIGLQECRAARAAARGRRAAPG